MNNSGPFPDRHPAGYPRTAFTLVELLVVIGIIALLISVLLPALAKARESANTIKCASNLHNIGLSMSIYLAENSSTFPAAYTYNGTTIDYTTNTQLPASATSGYVNWSGYFYGSQTNNANAASFTSVFGWSMFQCPSTAYGGLPACCTFASNLMPGQSTGGTPTGSWNGCDLQSPRLAYTVNEALCPRNKFVTGFNGNPYRYYQFVKSSQVSDSSNTILATEFNQDWRIPQNSNPQPMPMYSYSHRPVSGFVRLSGSSAINMDALPQYSAGVSTYRRAVVGDLQKNATVGGTVYSTLDWVGRNHGSSRFVNGFQMKTSNFLYVDGHSETKNIADTLTPFQWGDRLYSLTPNIDVQP